MGNEITLTAEALDTTVIKARDELKTANGLQRALITARAIGALRKGLAPLMPVLMDLQDTKLGFLTDKKKEGGYNADIVADVAIEASLQGARMTGNEVNIIAGNAYLTKEFFVRAMREYPGLTDLCLDFDVPATAPNGAGALVAVRATWSLDGKPQEMIFAKTDRGDNRICVKVNSGMGADAILGKAERKARSRIWQRLTGSIMSDAEIDDADGARVVSSTTRTTAAEVLRAPVKSIPQTEAIGATSVLRTLTEEAESVVTIPALNDLRTRVMNSFTRKEITSDQSARILEHLEQKRAALKVVPASEADQSQDQSDGHPNFNSKFAACKTLEDVNDLASDLTERDAPKEWWHDIAAKRRKELTK